MKSVGLGSGLGMAAGAYWPLQGVVRKDAVRCYCNGRWETLSPDRYEVIDIGAGEHAERNRLRNRRQRSAAPSWSDESFDQLGGEGDGKNNSTPRRKAEAALSPVRAGQQPGDRFRQS